MPPPAIASGAQHVGASLLTSGTSKLRLHGEGVNLMVEPKSEQTGSLTCVFFRPLTLILEVEQMEVSFASDFKPDRHLPTKLQL